MTRLDTLSPDLANKLHRSSAAQQCAATLVACEFAITHAEIKNPLVQEALEKIRSGGGLPSNKKDEIEALVRQLDERYFDLQEAAEEGRADPDDYLQAFAQARAVAAVLCGLKDHPLEASSEAIYEAAAVTDEPDKLFSSIDAILQ